MAAEDAKKFLDHVSQNPDVQAKVQDARAHLVNLGQEHGYDFSQEDLHDELRRRWGVTKPKDDPDTTTLG